MTGMCCRAVAFAAGCFKFALGLFVVGVITLGVQAQTVPPAAITSSQTLVNISGNSGHLAVNSHGTMFYVSQGANTVYMLAPGSTTPVAVMTGLSGTRSVAIDKSNNLYIPINWKGQIIEIPFLNGSYATGIAYSSSYGGGLSPCGSPATGTCVAIGNGGSATNGYLQSTDLAFDGSGNVYVVDRYDNYCPGTCNRILKFPAGTAFNGTATIIADGLKQTDDAAIAVDAEGDVFYTDHSNLYYVVSGQIYTKASLPPTIGSGLNGPGGVSIDQYGNLIITDTGNNRLVEMPAVNGVPQTSKQFVLSYTYSANGVAIDPQGNIYFTGYANGSTNFGVMSTWGFNLGASAIGTATATKSLSVVFGAAQTVAGVAISGSPAFTLTGGSCAAGSFTQSQSCTLSVAYTPSTAGPQRGAVVITDASGKLIAATNLYGTGKGAALTVDPGTVSAIGSGWKSPSGIAVDSLGNVYVADSAANAVYGFAAGSTTGTSIGSGLLAPTGVAADGAGNLYIADAGNGRVVRVPFENGAPTTADQSVVLTGTSSMVGLATDLGGNVYVADAGNARVLRLVNTGGSPNANYMATLGSGFKYPVAVAVDGSGDVFVADQSANTVSEIAVGSNTPVAIGSGLSNPSGLTVDGAGSLYIADTGNFRLLKVPMEGTSFNPNDQYQTGAGIATPSGVAIDATGNLYVVDSTHSSASLVVRTQGSLKLGNANVNTTTSQLSAEMANSGNQTLTFGTPLYAEAGTPSVFAVTSPSSGGCAAAGTLAPGFACSLAATFTPAARGSFTDTLSFSSNAANAAAPALVLAGKGTFLAPTQVVLAVTSPTGTPALGQPVTVSATITSTQSGGLTPTGTVSFLLDGAPTGGTITLGSNGAATVTFTSLSGGSHTVGASYSGDDNFAAGAATAISFSVAKSTSTTTLVIASANQNPQSGAPGASESLTATVTQVGAPLPTGTVTFLSGTTVLGTAQVSGGQAQLVTTTLPTGTLNITASYGGDINYAGSVSGAVPLIITSPTLTVTASSGAATVTSGGQVNETLTITSIAGLSGIVDLSCSGLPANSTCSFTQNAFTIASGTPQSVSLVILTGQTPVVAPPAVGEVRIPGLKQGVPVTLAFLLLAPAGLASRKLRKRYRSAMRRLLAVGVLLLAAGAASTMIGCGSNFQGVTPKGQSQVTVTATANSGSTVVTQTAQIALTVQ